MAKSFQNFMNSVKLKIAKSSVFDLTHDVKMSCNMGYLVPSMFMDCVPGDKVNINTEALVRFMPLLAPMYHRVNVTYHTWFVPYRILWDNWSDYITQTKTAGLLPVFPTITVNKEGTNYTKLMDYFGIPNPTPIVTDFKNDEKISAMRFAAYQCCCNEFYRDQNLVDPINYKLIDGDNVSTELTTLRKRSWGHDYFTSNLPFAQKGDAVELPVTVTDAPVYRNVNPADGVPFPPVLTTDFNSTGASFPPDGEIMKIKNQVTDDTDVDTGELYADNTNTRGTTTINDFRLALQLQKYLERAAVGGTRLVEWIKSMFGVTLPDYTAQRPQYIGGSKTPVQISEVLNTTGTDTLPQGNMSGRAIGVNQGNGSSFFAREHGVVITLMSIMPETAYQDGIEREYFKVDSPFDFMNPMFAHLGEQETKYRELFAFGISGTVGLNTAETFGYLPRYSEYRTLPNRVAGEFRNRLNYWHMGRIFYTGSLLPQATPKLDVEFIECDATHRIFADTDPEQDKVLVHVLNKVRAVRQLPKFGTPSL